MLKFDLLPSLAAAGEEILFGFMGHDIGRLETINIRLLFVATDPGLLSAHVLLQ